MILMVSGCAEQIKVETPPWSNKQIAQMQEEIEIVPIIVIRF